MLRVANVVGSLGRGGVESWLMAVLRTLDPSEVRMDFVTHMDAPGAYEDEARALGARVLPCPVAGPLAYARRFRSLLLEHGPYDVVHSHVHHFSGFVLWLARRAGVPGRVAHSHFGAKSAENHIGLLRKGYFSLMERLIRENAVVRLACSKSAASALYGERWAEEGARLLYCACDATAFQPTNDGRAARAELGLSDDAFVVGHVGRLVPEKNHAFLLDIAEALVGIEPRAAFLLVGDGPLRGRIAAEVARRGLDRHVLLLGSRGDVPRLMRDAMDVFLLPSLIEGLPVVCLEAQTAGLPMLLSEAVTEEVDVLKDVIVRLGFEAPASAWAEALLALRGRRVEAARAARAMRDSPFDLARGVEALKRTYQDSVVSGLGQGWRAGLGANRGAA